jgi:hypothetical protein
VVTKKAVPTKKTAKKQVVKGDSYVCDVCGLSVVVDEVCGCVETHEILCCSQPMMPKKSKTKSVKK